MNTDFSSGSVLVIGDTMLDTYYLGGVKRISPEAPVPVVKVNRIQYTPGGAANVVNNLRALGCRSYLIGAAGADDNRDRLVSILNDLSIRHTLVESVNPTVTKIRIVGNHQQIARLDFENDTQRDQNAETEIIAAFDSLISGYQTVIISDYGKGICSDEVCRHIIASCRKSGKPVIVDPKKHEWEKYRGATIITPNMKELSDACGKEIVNSDEETSNAAEHLRASYNAGYVLVTRSEKGMTLAESGGISHLKVQAKEVYDVSGAGDTVVASLAAGISSGLDIHDAVRLANTAAGIAVSKFGTSPVSRGEISLALSASGDSKLIDRSLIGAMCDHIRAEGKKIVFTNGCFDILHRGHVSYLRKAKALGDILILGLNSDDSVRRIKGPERPLNRETDRAEVLAGLSSVDHIVFFNEDTPLDLIREIRPDVLVKGGDYSLDNIVGREYSNETVTIDFVDGYSTTDIISRMKES